SWELSQTSPPQKDSKPTSDLQLGRGNGPRPPPSNQDRNPTSDLQLDLGNSPLPLPFNQDSKLTTESQIGLGNSPKPILFSLNDKPNRIFATRPGKQSQAIESTRNIQPSFSSENAAIHSSISTQQIRQKVSKNDISHHKLPTFDGKDDYEGLIIPFNRTARRNELTEEEKLDMYIECLQTRRVNL
ncbi:Hypothetical predicted protein, partial [Mytilus galloprovincialis]